MHRVDLGAHACNVRIFWDSAVALDPEAPAEGKRMRFGQSSELRDLWLETGLEDLSTEALEVVERYESFDDYWEPFTAGIGPGGAYFASLRPEVREALRNECRRRLGDPAGAFELGARAWAVRGSA